MLWRVRISLPFIEEGGEDATISIQVEEVGIDVWANQSGNKRQNSCLWR